ncbi:alpha/beta fold hydrolase [Nocardia salmonicida]|uniref:alpha/beta fold hydrolase n=1 Tax=Nocardia salmonicida TaxID=53431 RepID=UPI0037B42FE8
MNVYVLIHGLGGRWRHWAATIPELARTHRVPAVDLPGFGDSEKPQVSTIGNAVAAIDALRQQCEVERIDVVGHSMGTVLALYRRCARDSVTTSPPR